MSFINRSLVAGALFFSVTAMTTPVYAASSEGMLQQQLTQMYTLLERLQSYLLGQVITATTAPQIYLPRVILPEQ